MYSSESISALKQRIGFGSGSTLPITVADDHKIGTSGRLFSFFHKLVTLENLYATVEEINLTEEDFNAYLEQMKQDAVLSVLTRIMHQNKEYLDSFDYSDILLKKVALFDEPIGYTLAVTALEQMVSTARVNDNERSSNIAYNKLKIELEGVTDDHGRLIAKGIISKLYASIKKASDIIFPAKPLTIDNAPYW